MNVSGTALASAQEGVFITDVIYKSNNNASIDDSKIVGFYETLLNSEVVLSPDPTIDGSSITYTVNVYNNSDINYIYVGTFFEEEFYSNDSITFSYTNLNDETVVQRHQPYSFDITFSYVSGVTPSEEINKLISSLNIKFEPANIKETLSGIEFNYLLKNSEYAPEGDVYEYYSVDANRAIDNTVKIIEFGKTSDYVSEVSGLTAEPIDVYRTGSISLYRKSLGDGTYKIYILSDSGNFILNPNAAWMFDKLYSLEKIVNLHLLDTSNVTNMRDMFCDCAKLVSVDLSNFDTSNVTNMIGMFARMKAITYLDLTTFDTSNVTEMGQMFTNDTVLKRIYVSNNWDVSSKVATEDGGGVFTNCTNLVGNNGTVLDTTKITYTMAVVDTASTPGYLSNSYNFDTGLNVNHVIKNKSQAEIDAWDISSRYADSSITSITFGRTRDYYKGIYNYNPVAVDAHRSGVISIYRIPNGSNFDVYVLSDTGTFPANSDSSWMFDKFNKLQSINNLTMLDTSNVTNMRDFFCDLQAITTVDLSGFNTSNVTSMEGMFARMYNIETLDLSSFNTSAVTTFSNMFSLSISSTETHADYMTAIPKLKTVYVSNNWTVANATQTHTVFANTVNLVGGNGTVFNSANVKVPYAVADTATTPGYFTLKIS